MQSRIPIIALVIFGLMIIVLGGVALIGREGPLLSNFTSAIQSIATLVYVVCGFWGLIASLGLTLDKVQPGKIWGFSPLGNLLMGLGGLLAGVVALYVGPLWGNVVCLVSLALSFKLHEKARKASVF